MRFRKPGPPLARRLLRPPRRPSLLLVGAGIVVSGVAAIAVLGSVGMIGLAVGVAFKMVVARFG